MAVERLKVRDVEIARNRERSKFHQASRDDVGFRCVERVLIRDAQQIGQHPGTGVGIGIQYIQESDSPRNSGI